MTQAQKIAKEKFKKAIEYRKRTGCSLKEAFAHIYGKKVGATKKKSAKKSAPKSSHKDSKSHNVNIRVVSGSEKITAKNFTRINNDTYGNPRYVIHWINVADTYSKALTIAKKIGGRKFHNKQYGGGIAFQSYNIDDTAKRLNELVNGKLGAIKIIQKGESANAKVTKVLQQTRGKKGLFKGYKRISGIGFTLDKFNRLKH